MACGGLMLTGCLKQPAPPIMRATTRITAQVYSVPDMGIQGIDHVEVPREHVPEVLKIVTPVTFIKGGIVTVHGVGARDGAVVPI